MEKYDLIIVGGGPGGLTAAMYAARKKLSTLVITKEIGGQTAKAATIENYPAIEKISGIEWIKILESQAKKFGAKIIYKEVTDVNEKNGGFVVTAIHNYDAKAVILALGKTPKSLGVENERELTGRGISYCTTCDGPLFAGKNVAVVGGGNAAVDSASFLSKIAKKVYLIHRREEFKADESSLEKLKEKANVEFLLNYIIEKFEGKTKLTGIEIRNVKTGKKKKIKLDGTFIEVGSEVKTDFLKKLVKTDEFGQIIVNNKCETSHPGIFAVGDITDTPFKQMVVSAGDGAKAALQAYNYLKNIKPKISIDWH